MSTSDCYRLANQKLLHELKVIDRNINALKCRVLTPPCISIDGIDKLSTWSLLYRTKQNSPPMYKDVIYKLFMMLNIPHYWIHSITHPCRYTVNIYLVTDSLKVKVYQTIQEHLVKTDQKSVSVKLITT